MKASLTLVAWSLAAVLAGVTPQALAGEGHDHGDTPAPVAGPMLPRFTAVSELFELVGVVDGKHITLYLDRFADNSPVKDATLELQLDGKAISVEPHAEGEFEATLQEAVDADLLIHVVDAANPNYPEQIGEVQRVLGEIGAGAVPQMHITLWMPRI